MQIGAPSGEKNGTWAVLTVNKRRCQNDGTRLLRPTALRGKRSLPPGNVGVSPAEGGQDGRAPRIKTGVVNAYVEGSP